MKHILFAAAAIVIGLATRSTASAGVIVVQNGVPDLSNTINAATPGDTILVKGGGSDGVITITAKPLTVVVDPPGSYQVTGVHVRDLPAGQTCSVSGFVIAGQVAGVEVTNCAGSVRIADITSGVATFLSNSFGASVQNSADVSLARCVLRGTNGFNPSYQPSVGLIVGSGSRVAAFDSSFVGGEGARAILLDVSTTPAQPGAAGVQVDATSQFFASASSLGGGKGGDGHNIGCYVTICAGPSGGAMGGTALQSTSGAVTTTIGTMLQGGAGGSGGAGGLCCGFGSPPTLGPGPNGAAGASSTGPVTTLTGNAVRASIRTYSRVHQALPITITGQAGDEAFLAVSLGGQWLFGTIVGGVLTPGTMLRRVALGTIPVSGVLQTSLAVPELAGVTTAFLIHLQPVTVSPALERHVGPGQTVCWLGSTY